MLLPESMFVVLFSDPRMQLNPILPRKVLLYSCIRYELAMANPTAPLLPDVLLDICIFVELRIVYAVAESTLLDNTRLLMLFSMLRPVAYPKI